MTMKILVIPDSFKGTLSSAEVGTIIREEIKRNHPDYEVFNVPVADGGEGTVEAVLTARPGKRIKVNVSGPYYDRMDVEYAYYPEDNMAVMEMASCRGLPLVADRMNPELTTTYGVGEMVLDAVSRGIENIYIGLGGSCTTDGGCGFASALGVRFLDENGNSFVPVGGTLKNISNIVPVEIGSEIRALCDVTNPLYGPSGASYVFARQKGADDEAIERLDQGLRHLADVVENKLHLEMADCQGSGAAGGLGYGMMVFSNAAFDRGINKILDIIDYERLIEDVDIVITGEGKLDSQSFQGKVIDGIISRSPGKRVIMVVGMKDDTVPDEYEVYSTMNNGRRFPQSKDEAVDNLRKTVDEIVFQY